MRVMDMLTNEYKYEFKEHIFSDFDYFKQSLKGWDTNPTQISSGQLNLNYKNLTYTDLSLATMKIDQLLTDPCAQRDGWFNFVVCLSPFIFCGTEVLPGFMMVFAPGRDYHNIVPKNWSSIEIAVSESLLHEQGLHIPSFANLAPEKSILPLNRVAFARFIALEKATFPSIDADILLREQNESVPAIRERTLQLVVSSLSDAQWASFDTTELRRVPRIDLTIAALELIESSDLDLLSVSQIARSLGVSSRALQYAFRAAGLGGPAQYLLALRLKHSRRSLLRPNSTQGAVTRAAMDGGFWHLGRFSQQYRNLFAELPSETLSKTARISGQKNS